MPICARRVRVPTLGGRCGKRLMTNGVAIDLAAVILANAYVRDVLAKEDASEGQKRMAVRTAILLARPA
ncbi:hypothetical protein [Methylobacterium sp. ID0610]|uniref:hypothetical protein n=1 Tax=Methylobacterium carpenticola TaxID=3344827 RepID=UPI0036C7EE36